MNKGNEKKKKILLPVIVVAAVVGVGVIVGSKKSDNIEVSTTTQRTITAEELLNLNTGLEDRGIIRQYSTGSMGAGFKITYVNEQSKVKNIALNDLYVIDDVAEFKGSTLIVKTFSNKELTNDQISIVANTISQDLESALNLRERLINGDKIEVGFIVNNKEEDNEK